MTAPVVAGNPLGRAQSLLGSRLTEHRSGWHLDGRAASIAQVIAAANAVAANHGWALIAYPGVAEIQRKVRR